MAGYDHRSQRQDSDVSVNGNSEPLRCLGWPVLLALALIGCSTRPAAIEEMEQNTVSLDVPETPFSSYDAQFFSAVERRWHSLLGSSAFKHRPGKVIIDFVLRHDGKVTDLKVRENEVDEIFALICQRSILDPAPYPHWTDDMRLRVGANRRTMSITFHYKN